RIPRLTALARAAVRCVRARLGASPRQQADPRRTLGAAVARRARLPPLLLRATNQGQRLQILGARLGSHDARKPVALPRPFAATAHGRIIPAADSGQSTQAKPAKHADSMPQDLWV